MPMSIFTDTWADAGAGIVTGVERSMAAIPSDAMVVRIMKGSYLLALKRQLFIDIGEGERVKTHKR